MPELSISKLVGAKPDAVFALFSDLDRVSDRVRGVTRIEKLTDDPMAVGTRWRETRKRNGKETTQELKVSALQI